MGCHYVVDEIEDCGEILLDGSFRQVIPDKELAVSTATISLKDLVKCLEKNPTTPYPYYDTC